MNNAFRRQRNATFNQIQANLRDRYVSGFPILKELIQNAKNAQARMVRFIASPGWANIKNPLLRILGVLVVNDGLFREKHGECIRYFAASAKGDETAATGRFGFGQISAIPSNELLPQADILHLT